MSTSAATSARADDLTAVGLEAAATAIAWLTTHANGILATAYDRAPVLVTVLAALLILPVTALAALLAQSLRLRVAEARHTRRLTAPPSSRHAPPPPPAPIAWLTDHEGRRVPLPPQLRLVRIGRHDDNDVCLTAATVHRHHAVIHRTEDLAYVISDISGSAGNGVSVNGTRIAEARLAPGDTIELGSGRLTFDSALPAYVGAFEPSASTTHQPTTR